MPDAAPTGRQHRIAYGDQEAVVVELGGGPRSYRAAGRDVLDGYAEHEKPAGARGHPLAPWPNRLRDGRYRWDGQEHQLPLTEPETATALHGLVRWERWEAAATAPHAVEMRYVLHPRPGYPFTLELAIAYALGREGLTVTTTARNAGDRPLPYAIGQHPYLATGGLVDACTVELDAQTYLETDDRGLPTGRRPVEGTPYDFRTPALVGPAQLDTAYTDLARDADGRAWLTLQTARGTTRLWVDGGYRWLQLFSGDTLPDRRREGLGVEPMTAPPNALADLVDVVRLEPGQTSTSRWGLIATS